MVGPTNLGVPGGLCDCCSGGERCCGRLIPTSLLCDSFGNPTSLWNDDYWPCTLMGDISIQCDNASEPCLYSIPFIHTSEDGCYSGAPPSDVNGCCTWTNFRLCCTDIAQGGWRLDMDDWFFGLQAEIIICDPLYLKFCTTSGPLSSGSVWANTSPGATLCCCDPVEGGSSEPTLNPCDMTICVEIVEPS